MKHRIKGRKLNRNSAHRKALLRNLAIALIKSEAIKTTLPKAKELRPYIEKLMTIAKTNSLANRRLLQSIVANDEAVTKLVNEIGPRIIKRNGGYTRILKHGFRTGDNAPMAYMEIVDKIEVVEKIEENTKS